VNNFHSELDCRIYANRIIQHLNKLLKEGYHFDSNKVPYQQESQKRQTLSVKDALTFALEIKKSSIRVASYPSYKSTVGIFNKWAASNGLQDIDIVYFDKLRVIYFDDYLLVERGYAAKIVIGHIAYLKSLFQVLVERGVILNNPLKASRNTRRLSHTKTWPSARTR